MKRRYFVIAFILVLVVGVFVCCNAFNTSETDMEKIQSTLMDMNGYEAEGTLKRVSNKGENTYDFKQYYKSSGEYRLEFTGPETVAGNFTVYDGASIYQYNPRVDGKVIANVPASQSRNELFLGQFVKNYMQSEGVAIETAALDESVCTVLEAVIPGGNKYLATEKLWVNNETLKPEKFVIYDENGVERYVLTFTEFEYKDDFDESIFRIPQ